MGQVAQKGFNKVAVATARNIAVILHCIWVDGSGFRHDTQRRDGIGYRLACQALRGSFLAASVAESVPLSIAWRANAVSLSKVTEPRIVPESRPKAAITVDTVSAAVLPMRRAMSASRVRRSYSTSIGRERRQMIRSTPQCPTSARASAASDR